MRTLHRRWRQRRRQGWIRFQERFGVLSFPVGKIFHRGRLVGDFMGGSLAHEIVTEMLSIRDDLRRAEEATEAEAAAAAQ